MSDHITWRVHCRTPGGHCQEYPLQRLNKQMAMVVAEEHTNQQGHISEVVRVTFDVVATLKPEEVA